MRMFVSLAVPAILACSTFPTFAQLREYPDESLAGLKGVHVIVKYNAPDEQAYGLTQDELQKAVEVRLSADNIKVFDEKGWRQEPGMPYLFVNVVGTEVTTGRKDEHVYVYSFAADLIQKVSLKRRQPFTTEGATWSQGYFITVPASELNRVTLQISDVAHDFAESIHQANEGTP